MFPYWILFTICAAGALEHKRRNYRAIQGGPFLIVAAGIAMLMVGLRYEVGGDWINYVDIFNRFRYGEFVDVLFDSDPGYGLMNWAAQQVGADVWLVNTLCALIFTWGLVKFARQQPNPWLVMVVAVPYLIIVVAMGYTRQGVAIGFLLAGLATIHKHSIFRFAIYIALAAAFHKTAVIVLPLVALSIVQQRASASLLILILGALLYYVFLQSAVDRFLMVYVESNYESEGAAIRVAMNLVPAAIFLLFEKRFNLPENETKLWRILSYAAFGSLLLLLTLTSSTAVDRLALYLIPIQLFVLPRVPYAFPSRGQPNGQVALGVIIYCAVVQFVWLNYSRHSEAWLPYQIYPVGSERPLVPSS